MPYRDELRHLQSSGPIWFVTFLPASLYHLIYSVLVWPNTSMLQAVSGFITHIPYHFFILSFILLLLKCLFRC